MDLSSFFDWMDLLIFALAILGSIGVIYAGFQLYIENQEAKASPVPANNIPTPTRQIKVEPKAQKNTSKAPSSKLGAKASNIPESSKKVVSSTREKEAFKTTKSPAQSKNLGYANPSPSKKKKSILSFWKKEETSKAEMLGEIMPPKVSVKQNDKNPGSIPELIADELKLQSPQSLSLKLKVKGNRILYKKISQGSYNELKIKHQPSANKPPAKRYEYSMGNLLSFSIHGENAISKTYQFTIYFADQSGNEYSQQVAGLGREYPIIERPVKVK